MTDSVQSTRPGAAGYLAVLGSAALWGTSGVLIKFIVAYAFAFAALALLPLQALTPQPSAVPLTGWLWFAALIGLATILPFSLYAAGLRRLPAGAAGILSMSEVLFVSLYAYVLLGERLAPLQVLGAGLVIAGAASLSWANKGG